MEQDGRATAAAATAAQQLWANKIQQKFNESGDDIPSATRRLGST